MSISFEFLVRVRLAKILTEEPIYIILFRRLVDSSAVALALQTIVEGSSFLSGVGPIKLPVVADQVSRLCAGREGGRGIETSVSYTERSAV